MALAFLSKNVAKQKQEILKFTKIFSKMFLTGLQVVSEDSFDESASISTNDGSSSQSGTLLQAQENIDAETAVQEQEIDQSEFVEDNNLSRAVSTGLNNILTNKNPQNRTCIKQ